MAGENDELKKKGTQSGAICTRLIPSQNYGTIYARPASIGGRARVKNQLDLFPNGSFIK